MTVRRSILVFEYLLANPLVWQAASQSMQTEATAMLNSVVRDIGQLQGVRPTVLLSAHAASRMTSCGSLDEVADIVVSDIDPLDWLRRPSRPPAAFDATLVIAPESDGILVDLLRLLQSEPWMTCQNLNVPWMMAELFSDKYRTFQWLLEQGILTPETKTLGEDQVVSIDRLVSTPRAVSNMPEPLPDSSPLGIVKPRYGVGCEGIFFVPMDQPRLKQAPLTVQADSRWILQRYLPGVACSVGFIGGGSRTSTTVLLPAEQNLVLESGSPCYLGGRIPCRDDIAACVSAVAARLAGLLGSFSGYLGADIVVSQGEGQLPTAYVIEINPRLCTSYTGYRMLAKENLASILLQQSSGQELQWESACVTFSSDGSAILRSQ